MARIPSPNPDFAQQPVPSGPVYRHPVDERAHNKPDIPIPMAFQVTSPFDRFSVLLPHALVLHVNPKSLTESHNQKVERFQTRGGFVEQHWGQELVEISADASTGAFMNIRTGLTSVLRQRTIAWDRFRDLHDLFRNNGSLHDPFGNIVLQGQIMLMYDRGIYIGTFRSFEWEDTEESPFAFTLNWSFKVEHTVMNIEVDIVRPAIQAPGFQAINTPELTPEQQAAQASAKDAVEIGKEAGEAGVAAAGVAEAAPGDGTTAEAPQEALP